MIGLLNRVQVSDAVSGFIAFAGERIIDMQRCDYKSICHFVTKNNNYRLVRVTIKKFSFASGILSSSRIPAKLEKEIVESPSGIPLGLCNDTEAVDSLNKASELDIVYATPDEVPSEPGKIYTDMP